MPYLVITRPHSGSEVQRLRSFQKGFLAHQLVELRFRADDERDFDVVERTEEVQKADSDLLATEQGDTRHRTLLSPP